MFRKFWRIKGGAHGILVEHVRKIKVETLGFLVDKVRNQRRNPWNSDEKSEENQKGTCGILMRKVAKIKGEHSEF